MATKTDSIGSPLWPILDGSQRGSDGESVHGNNGYSSDERSGYDIFFGCSDDAKRVTNLDNIPPSKKSGWLYKALVATVVVLAVLAAFVGAGLAIHYTVGLHHALEGAKNFFGKQLTVGEALV